jgi:hypothetical protein
LFLGTFHASPFFVNAPSLWKTLYPPLILHIGHTYTPFLIFKLISCFVSQSEAKGGRFFTMFAKHYDVPVCSANKKTSPPEILFTGVELQEKIHYTPGLVTQTEQKPQYTVVE